jgi:hypothetical protein
MENKMIMAFKEGDTITVFIWKTMKEAKSGNMAAIEIQTCMS